MTAGAGAASGAGELRGTARASHGAHVPHPSPRPADSRWAVPQRLRGQRPPAAAAPLKPESWFRSPFATESRSSRAGQGENRGGGTPSGGEVGLRERGRAGPREPACRGPEWPHRGQSELQVDKGVDRLNSTNRSSIHVHTGTKQETHNGSSMTVPEQHLARHVINYEGKGELGGGDPGRRPNPGRWERDGRRPPARRPAPPLQQPPPPTSQKQQRADWTRWHSAKGTVTFESAEVTQVEARSGAKVTTKGPCASEPWDGPGLRGTGSDVSAEETAPQLGGFTR